MPTKQPTLFTDAPVTVSQITGELRDLLNETYADVSVIGEVTNLNKHISGHYYFSIKDASATLKCKMWSSSVKRLKFEMKNGLTIIVKGQLDFYAPYGECSLIASSIVPQGIGPLELAFRQLYEKLEAKGWFSPEHKKPIPTFPKRLGLVTSESGAVLRDMLRIIRERWALTEIWVVPVPVQGETAAGNIAKTITRLNSLDPQPDLLILARGGGSLEDLWAFNEEVLAEAIHRSSIPIITGIGHEPDTTIADMVADLRAPTPTAAAGLAVPSRSDWHERLTALYRTLRHNTVDQLRWEWERLQRLRQHRLFARPMQQLTDARENVDDWNERLVRATTTRLVQLQKDLARQASMLAALSPLQVLSRGYSLTRKLENGDTVSRSNEVEPGETLETVLHQGKIRSTVISRE
ncbi:MAG: exodeoxyribonuclease VII large subunit [Planctomycetia bacterium]|nr:exodeoxyribonuclease VII large subunit [Planctomycetia bacterium]